MEIEPRAMDVRWEERKDLVADPLDRRRSPFIVSLPSLLTKEECWVIRRLAEERGWKRDERAYRTTGHTTVPHWLQEVPPAIARTIKSIEGLLPVEWDTANCSIENFSCQLQAGDKLRRVGLHSDLRCLLYSPKDFFRSHYDTFYTISSPDVPPREHPRGVFTIMIYLNDSSEYEGGKTRFTSSECPGIQSTNMCTSQQCEWCKDFEGKVGDVLIFQHDVRHQGSVVLNGVKCVGRTEVIYQYQYQHQ
eukprot:TRINITY_DN14784_c0_g1_i1.p1 TRINITY_DN14784_c0_g1~~TRINITY_DN14784_c0_g1_i1.p1  ORF type:complete len:248 (-),score=41.88 TRINITY_DN14784_c0_g1_i1:23-766(-)